MGTAGAWAGTAGGRLVRGQPVHGQGQLVSVRGQASAWVGTG